MTRFIALILATVALLAVAVAPAMANEESQGWAPKPGSTDTKHIHTKYNLTIGQTVSAPFTLNVTSLFHNRTVGDKITLVRWATQDGIVASKAVSHTATGANVEQWVDDLPFDPAAAAHSGWQEIRVTANVVLADGSVANREFSTTRTCVFLQSSKPRSDYCWSGSATAPSQTTRGRCGGGAWYGPNGASLETADPGYLIVNIACPDVLKLRAGVHPGDTFQVRTQNKGGGIGVWDPDFHNGNLGTDQFTTAAGNVWKTVAVPNLSPGLHTLHVRDTYHGFSGAYVLPVTIL